MAFIPHKFDDGQAMPFEMLPAAGSLTLVVGTALIVSSGLLVLATGTNKPTYLSRVSRDSTTEGEFITVERTADKVTYETELSEADTDIAVGEKHTIDATGGKITATTVSGVAEVVSFDGTGAGDKVRIRL